MEFGRTKPKEGAIRSSAERSQRVEGYTEFGKRSQQQEHNGFGRTKPTGTSNLAERAQERRRFDDGAADRAWKYSDRHRRHRREQRVRYPLFSRERLRCLGELAVAFAETMAESDGPPMVAVRYLRLLDRTSH
jgi:hypothetical protein